MARIDFTLRHPVALPARAVFDELVDWRGHAQWVPMTRVVIESGDGGPGTVFIATTGLGPAALPDRMRVESLDPQAMTVRIVKIGPVLRGDVDIAVTEAGPSTCVVIWRENIVLPWLPQLLSGPVAAATRKGFEKSLDRMARKMRQGLGVRSR
jgi:hypothetical protein